MKTWFQRRAEPAPANLALELAVSQAHNASLADQLQDAKGRILELERVLEQNGGRMLDMLDRVVSPTPAPVVHVHTVAPIVPEAAAPVVAAAQPDRRVLYSPKVQSAINAFAGVDRELQTQLMRAAEFALAEDPSLTEDQLALRIAEGETPDVSFGRDRDDDAIIPSDDN
jgi:hypothetical protein